MTQKELKKVAETLFSMYWDYNELEGIESALQGISEESFNSKYNKNLMILADFINEYK